MRGTNPWSGSGVSEDYDFTAWFTVIHKPSPNTVSFAGPTGVRWIGNEDGSGHNTEWSSLPTTGDPNTAADHPDQAGDDRSSAAGDHPVAGKALPGNGCALQNRGVHVLTGGRGPGGAGGNAYAVCSFGICASSSPRSCSISPVLSTRWKARPPPSSSRPSSRCPSPMMCQPRLTGGLERNCSPPAATSCTFDQRQNQCVRGSTRTCASWPPLASLASQV